jgi:hypothetical protein
VTPAAIGLRAHSGWAALVAVAGPARKPTILLRTRVKMTDGSLAGAKQPFHAAEEMPLARAEAYIDRCVARAGALAFAGLRAAVGALEAAGHRAVSCGLLLASGRPLGSLEDTLASHAKIHTADGEHFRDALASGTRRCGMGLLPIREREVWEKAARRARLPVADFQRIVADCRKTVGSPWTADEKLATAAAIAAFAASPKGRA